MPQLVPPSSSTKDAKPLSPASSTSSTTILRDYRVPEVDENYAGNTCQLQQDLDSMLQDPKEPASATSENLRRYIYIGVCAILAIIVVSLGLLLVFSQR